MAHQTEQELEIELINKLQNLGYKYNTNLRTQDGIRENILSCLNEVNKERLNGEPIEKKEYDRLLSRILQQSVLKSAELIRDLGEIERDNGSKQYIDYIHKDSSKNKYEVCNQVNSEKGRFDVVLFINGFPVVLIELKARGKAINEAFYQIEKSYRKTDLKNFFRFFQLFVVSNGVETKYYANSDNKVDFTSTNHWSDETNNKVCDILDFATSFLSTSSLTKTILNYTIINTEENLLCVMRPYQIYGLEAAIAHVLNSNENGFLWHTTGSGKTLTSYKTSKEISKLPDVKKVIFLVDRKDLDGQTISEFNKFETKFAEPVDSCKTLADNLGSNSSFVVTTIQKLSRLINSNSVQYAKIVKKYKNEKVVFVVDECHRSQFGIMHKSIKKAFLKAQFIGFTGTPRFKENAGKGGITTFDIFGKILHTYLIKDAIKDGNVLGFSVQYVKTFNGDYDNEDKTKVYDIDTKEVFQCDERINKIADYINASHEQLSRKNKFKAILATPSIPVLLKYYSQFKEKKCGFKFTAIFSFGHNAGLYDEENSSNYKNELSAIINDYNSMSGTSYTIENYPEFITSVINNLKREEGCVDILIVVNMCLTGFDSKYLNTLYVDKELVHHDLLQAYSRTNRTCNGYKPFGNIVCFRNLKERTDEAICLFSHSDSVEDILMREFSFYEKEFLGQWDELCKIAPRVDDTYCFESEEKEKEFVLAFQKTARAYNSIQNFVEFNPESYSPQFSEQKYRDYKSRYLSIFDKSRSAKAAGKSSVLADIEFDVELIEVDKIDVDYILRLLSRISLSDEAQKTKDIKAVLAHLEKSDSLELRKKVNLLEMFLKTVVPFLHDGDNTGEKYVSFIQDEGEKEILSFCESKDIKPDFIKEIISQYAFSGVAPTNKSIRLHIRENNDHLDMNEEMSLIKEVRSFCDVYRDKYE